MSDYTFDSDKTLNVPKAGTSALPLVTAALLIEMTRMDDQVTSDEWVVIGRTLQKEFSGLESDRDADAARQAGVA